MIRSGKWSTMGGMRGEVREQERVFGFAFPSSSPRQRIGPPLSPCGRGGPPELSLYLSFKLDVNDDMI